MNIIDYILIWSFVGTAILLGTWIKMGPVGRLMLRTNLPGWRGDVRIGVTPSGGLVFQQVQQEGDNIKAGKINVSYLPKTRPNPRTEQEKNYNEVLKAKAFLPNGVRVWFGSLSAGVASNPQLIALLQKLRLMQKTDTEDPEFEGWDIQTLEEFVPLSWSPHDSDMMYRMGYLDGVGFRPKTNLEKALPFIAIIGGIFVFWWLWSTGALQGILGIKIQ